MSYDLHITYRADWPEPEGSEISFDEWMAVVNTDLELRIEGYINLRLPDRNVSRRPPTRDASTTQNYRQALCRHLGFKFICGDPVGNWSA